MRYYVDTCIWRDYFENRADNFRPLGEWAFKFFKHVIENNSRIILSNFVRRELRHYFSSSYVEDMIAIIPGKLLINIRASKSDYDLARIVQNKFRIHFDDAIHAVLARQNNSIMVTRDAHFLSLGDFIVVRKPEDLIH